MDAAIVRERGKGLDGSSFVAVQLWMHDFKAFDAMSSAEQDNAIGRSHVKRTAQESFDPEAFVLRRSMPWAEGMRGGLNFVAFGKSFDGFEAQLKRMVGAEDGSPTPSLNSRCRFPGATSGARRCSRVNSICALWGFSRSVEGHSPSLGVTFSS